MSFKPKKKILVISLSVILILAFSLVYVNFFMPKASAPTTKTNKVVKTKKSSPVVNSSTENSKKQESSNETVNSKPSETNTSSQSSSSNNKKTVFPKAVPKPSIPQISDSTIKTLLYNGDVAIRNFYSSAYFKNSNTKNPINLDNITYSEMIPAINSYNALQNFMRKNYNLNAYYTESFIRKFMDETFRYVNGKYYIGVGNYGIMLRYDSSFKVISKVYSKNFLYIKIAAYWADDKSPSTINCILYYSGNNWLIYRFDDWGIPALRN